MWAKELEALQFALEPYNMTADMRRDMAGVYVIMLYYNNSMANSFTATPLAFMEALIEAKRLYDAKQILQGKPEWRPNPF
jgi:hypothetical protein